MNPAGPDTQHFYKLLHIFTLTCRTACCQHHAASSSLQQGIEQVAWPHAPGRDDGVLHEAEPPDTVGVPELQCEQPDANAQRQVQLAQDAAHQVVGQRVLTDGTEPLVPVPDGTTAPSCIPAHGPEIWGVSSKGQQQQHQQQRDDRPPRLLCSEAAHADHVRDGQRADGDGLCIHSSVNVSSHVPFPHNSAPHKLQPHLPASNALGALRLRTQLRSQMSARSKQASPVKNPTFPNKARSNVDAQQQQALGSSHVSAASRAHLVILEQLPAVPNSPHTGAPSPQAFAQETTEHALENACQQQHMNAHQPLRLHVREQMVSKGINDSKTRVSAAMCSERMGLAVTPPSEALANVCMGAEPCVGAESLYKHEDLPNERQASWSPLRSGHSRVSVRQVWENLAGNVRDIGCARQPEPHIMETISTHDPEDAHQPSWQPSPSREPSLSSSHATTPMATDVSADACAQELQLHACRPPCDTVWGLQEGLVEYEGSSSPLTDYASCGSSSELERRPLRDKASQQSYDEVLDTVHHGELLARSASSSASADSASYASMLEMCDTYTSSD